MALVITRKPGEAFYIGDNVKVTFVGWQNCGGGFAIEAPKEIAIHREEVWLAMKQNQQLAEPAAPQQPGPSSASRV
jgi:carbon storage regulator